MSLNPNNYKNMLQFQIVPKLTKRATLMWLQTLIDNSLYNDRQFDIVDYEIKNDDSINVGNYTYTFSNNTIASS